MPRRPPSKRNKVRVGLKVGVGDGGHTLYIGDEAVLVDEGYHRLSVGDDLVVLGRAPGPPGGVRVERRRDGLVRDVAAISLAKAC